MHTVNHPLPHSISMRMLMSAKIVEPQFPHLTISVGVWPGQLECIRAFTLCCVCSFRISATSDEYGGDMRAWGRENAMYLPTIDSATLAMGHLALSLSLSLSLSLYLVPHPTTTWQTRHRRRKVDVVHRQRPSLRSLRHHEGRRSLPVP